MDNAQFKQHVDYNVSPSKMRELVPEGSLLVREIFDTIQAEMPFAGQPAVFIRLGGCNLGSKSDAVCSACDTSFEVSKSKVMTFDEIAAAVTEATSGKERMTKLVVITGGEPLLQQDALEDLISTLASLPSLDIECSFQFETNGTIAPQDWMLDNNNIYIVVSPKTFGENSWWLNESVLEDGQVYIRQVLSADPNSAFHWPEYLDELVEDDRAEFVYLSPCTLYRDVNVIDRHSQANIDYVYEQCLDTGIKMSFQYHAYVGIR